MRYSNTHPHRQGPDAESCTDGRKQEKTLSIERRATLSLSDKWERQIKTSPKGVLFISFMASLNLAHMSVPISKATKILSVKSARQGRIDAISLQKDLKITQLGIVF